MKTGSRPPNPIVLIDDAIALLRSVPPSAWLGWAAGSLPFGLGLIAFATEMTSSASAADVLAGHSLVLALLFVWMVCRQSIFSQKLRSLLEGDPATRGVSVMAAARTHALVWSTALVMIPLSALSVAALPWALTFYYSAAAAPATGAREAMRYGVTQASTWAFSGVLEVGVAALLWLVAFVNAAVLLIGGPILLRALTGQESIFTRDPQGLLNGTLLVSAAVIACLALDPVLRGMYAIRSFRVDAIRTGVDLRAALARSATAAAIALILIAPCRGAERPLAINAPALDRSIHEVVRRPEYVWREPRPVETSASTNVFLRFSEDMGRLVARQIRRATDWIGDVVRTIARWLRGNSKPPIAAEGRAGTSAPVARAILYLLIVMVAGAGVALLLRVRLARRPKSAVAAEPVALTMDLNREDVSPDEAHEDEWMALAARFLDSGDLRLATRALYLAVLATLGRSGLISIHRARSNMDYRRELARRARGNAPLQEGFTEVVSVFERTWYGEHGISAEAFDRFRADAVSLRAHAQA